MVSDELIASVNSAARAASLRAQACGLMREAEHLTQAAEFHSAVSRAYLRDWLGRQAVEGGQLGAPVRRMGDASEGDAR